MIGLILTLALVGFVLYLILQYVPMPAPMKQAIVVLVVIFIIIYVLGLLGVADIPLPRLR